MAHIHKPLVVAVGLNTAIFAAEAAGGVRAQSLSLLGDAAHNPAQLQETDWVSRADMDPEVTRQTRRVLAERLEREQIVVAAGHFPAPGFGKVLRLQGRRYWQVL